MILLERITAVSAETMKGETHFEHGGLWKDARGVPSAWSLEVMAQVCAAFIGWHHQGKGIRRGRLVKVHDLRLRAAYLPYGETLAADVTLDSQSGLNFFVFQGTLCRGAHLLASAWMSILAK